MIPNTMNFSAHSRARASKIDSLIFSKTSGFSVTVRPLVLPLISKLQQGEVEVCYVTPVPA